MFRSGGMGGWRSPAAGDDKGASGGVGGHPPAVHRSALDRAPLDRRSLLRWAGTAAVAAPAAGVLAACGGGSSSGGQRKIRIGYVLPRTGALGSYSIIDSYVVASMRRILADGVKVGGRTYPVEIFVRDSASDRHGAGIAATDLIFKDKVDIVLAGGTSDTAIPVADQCEINQVPCISTIAPWQSWWYGRGGNVDMPFHWTYHFYWGVDDVVATYVAMWRQLGVTKVGLVYPEDDDGRAFASQDFGIPTISRFNFQVTSPGQAGFQPGTDAFRDYVEQFKQAGVQSVVGVAQAADLATFQRQVRAGNFTPKALTMSKALDFQEDVRALGSNGDALTTDVGWSPSHPFRSSLTNRTSRDLANDFATTRGRGWSPTLGFVYALFEVAVKALGGAASLDREAIVAAIREVDAQTIVGPVAFGSQPNVPKNVARVGVVGGQWDKSDTDFVLKIVNDSGNPRVPMDSQLRALPEQV
ncbi:ABC-type branched-chain amino acid transport system, periplasmic component [Frankia canadensis]|uniref:ABC-type branched-chain amino acid transport system, periplasmic component n=1 Tax=Frankia canadensis TaxID=1836972 RepID=A0A2I2KQL6_9ACTN|nr:ABC transporter substrate-binding protein [Frankia canadensis]SNQ47949.1 ABC-type branched-chain amino acid transport system, periplasmic component [Frankia canadensis]SOU55239.1 ABC-type branched-chain amino acid transport system, periplasmic component [Frankia canadensis]